MLCVWTVKGGSGCSVVSAALALLGSSQGPTVLVDLAGELPDVLGVDTAGPGVADWLAAPQPPPDALSRMELEITPDLSLLQLGELPGDEPETAVPGAIERERNDRLKLLARLLAGEDRLVVVDLGGGGNRYGPLLDAATRSVLVVRPCYLAVTRAARGRRADGIVVVREPGRALRASDIEDAVGAPVLATVPWDAGVARAVDAGVLLRRPIR